jgi:hypothetical protein
MIHSANARNNLHVCTSSFPNFTHQTIEKEPYSMKVTVCNPPDITQQHKYYKALSATKVKHNPVALFSTKVAQNIETIYLYMIQM